MSYISDYVTVWISKTFMTPSKLVHSMIKRCERKNACKSPVTMVHRVYHAYPQTCIIILQLYSL